MHIYFSRSYYISSAATFPEAQLACSEVFVGMELRRYLQEEEHAQLLLGS